jgi:hypothetical protein
LFAQSVDLGKNKRAKFPVARDLKYAGFSQKTNNIKSAS